MVLDILRRLENTPGRLDKIKIVSDEISKDYLFYRICRAALDPYTNYGITSKLMPEYAGWDINKKSLETLLNEVESKVANHNSSNQLVEDVTNIMKSSHFEDWEVIKRVILKDLRCGVQISTFNSALDSLMDHRSHTYKTGKQYQPITDYPCMLVDSHFEKFAKKVNWEEGIIIQEKYDGARFNAIVKVVDNNIVINYYGRSGKPMAIPNDRLYESIKTLAESIFEYATYYKARAGGLVLDGELLVINDNGVVADRKTGNGIVNKAVRGKLSQEEAKDLRAIFWDVIPLDLFISDPDAEYFPEYIERYWALEGNYTDNDYTHIAETKIVYSPEEAQEEFTKKLSEGKEGCVVKSKHNIWKDTRVTDCAKMKGVFEADLRIVGIVEGTGKYEGKLGALSCESEDGLLKVNVGTGYTDEERQSIDSSVVGKIVEVKYNMKITDKKTGVYSLFLPVFSCIRNDKVVANTNEEII